jgi:hypothetical protein
MPSTSPRVYSVRESLTILVLLAGVLIAIVGVALILEGSALLAAADAQFGSTQQPCNGHSACLLPGPGQPEGQRGTLDMIEGSVLLISAVVVSVLFGIRVARIRRGRSPIPR